jgi:PadR family transcriptional regulator PadR
MSQWNISLASTSDQKEECKMEKDATINWLKETRKGHIRLILLTLLSKKPHHGYEIMKEVKEKTQGTVRLTSGGVYRILTDLEKSKYIRGAWENTEGRKRKIYTITDTGLIVLERALTKQNELASSMQNLYREFLTGVLDVKLPENQTPKTPNLFAMYLEAMTEKPDDSAEILTQKRQEIENMIRKLRIRQRALDRRIALTKKNVAAK